MLACNAYEDCLDMVASGKAYATLVDANEAARLQDEIRKRDLRITKLIERPYPYVVFFYVDDNNRANIQKMMQCLDTLSPVYIEMLKSDSIPEIQYTTIEVVDPVELFTGEPYIGSIIVVIILVLSVAGVLTDAFSKRQEKQRRNQGQY